MFHVAEPKVFKVLSVIKDASIVMLKWRPPLLERGLVSNILFYHFFSRHFCFSLNFLQNSKDLILLGEVICMLSSVIQGIKFKIYLFTYYK